MKEIPLSQGKFAQVDDEDFDYLNQWKWHTHKGKYTYYAVRKGKKCEGAAYKKAIGMHQMLVPEAFQVDHIDCNGLNNQRNNLRPCTKQQNQHNYKKIRTDTASKFKGVTWLRNRWRARIVIRWEDGRKRHVHLGHFKIEADAAKAYNEAALKYFGEHARLNEIDEN